MFTHQLFRRTRIAGVITLATSWFLLDSANSQQTASGQAEYKMLDIDSTFRVIPLEEFAPANTEKPLSESDRFRQWSKHRSQVMSHRLASERKVVEELRAGHQPTKELDSWFNGYVFPMISRPSSDALAELDNQRRRFFRKYLQKTEPGPARQHLIEQLTIPVLKQLIHGNFHPAVRINAMIMLGDLNAVEGKRNQHLPEPHPAVFDELVAVIEDEQTSPSLRIVALASLQRHVQLRRASQDNPLSLQQNQKAAEIGLQLVTRPENDVDDEALDSWIRRRAVQLLAETGPSTVDGKIDPALVDLISDSSGHLWTRVDAVHAVRSRLERRLASVNLNDLLNSISELVADVAEQNANRLRTIEHEMLSVAYLLDGRIISQEEPRNFGFSPEPGKGVSPESDNPADDDKKNSKRVVVEIVPDYQRRAAQARVRTVTTAALHLIAGDDGEQGNSWLQGSFDSSDADRLAKLATEFELLIEATGEKNNRSLDPDLEEPITLAAQLCWRLELRARAIRHMYLGENDPEETQGASKGE